MAVFGSRMSYQFYMYTPHFVTSCLTNNIKYYIIQNYTIIEHHLGTFCTWSILRHEGIETSAGYDVEGLEVFCRSDKYEDELTWGAAWLYRVTNDTKYLTWAEQYYITGPDWGQSWDDKYSGNMVNYTATRQE